MENIKNEWRKKTWSIPSLLGSKKDYTKIINGLIQELSLEKANNLDDSPIIDCVLEIKTWRDYAPFLKSVGLCENYHGKLRLTEIGKNFVGNFSLYNLASLMHEKFKLFGELLVILNREPCTVREINEKLCELYKLNWKNLSNVRKRMDWLEVLELIEPIGNNKWSILEKGKRALSEWLMVTPELLESFEQEEKEYILPEVPTGIANLIQELSDNPSLHIERSTYNLWAPSPNKIENLRKILNYSCEKVTRSEFFKYIGDEFNLKSSSIESMMPFLKAAGLLEEVGRNIYMTTSEAKEWCETGSDIDFIRILHCKYRFVGEMVLYAEKDVTRNQIYAEAKKYGLNSEKARWIISFLVESNILEEPQYLHLKATSFGMGFIKTLPLTNCSWYEQKNDEKSEEVIQEISHPSAHVELFDKLKKAAIDPFAEGKASGVAFEEEIAKVFKYMGFEAKRIGGSGNTDVVVKWTDQDGKMVVGIVDGKSKTSGQVSHGDVSDVAIETHKEKNNADYVAIVGAGFSGDTIKNFAVKKGIALITDKELIDIAQSSRELGLTTQEIAMLFKTPDGLSNLEDIISNKQREKNLIKEVVSTFKKEQSALESISPRDMFLLLRMTDNSPSMEEIIKVFSLLSKEELNILKVYRKATADENTTYTMFNVRSSINRIRMISNAIEEGIDYK